MAASIKIAYGASTAITISASTLAGSSSRESLAIDNTSNLYLDALLRISATLATGSPGFDRAVYIYVAGSEDGTNYTDNATGADAAITLRAPTNLYMVGTIQTPDAGALTYQSSPLSIARAFGGRLPRKWSLVVKNFTNLAFTAFTATYSGVYSTSA